MSNIIVRRTIHTGSTIRGGRVMYRQARVTTTSGIDGLSIHEATTTGSIAAGEVPEGILFSAAPGESLTAATWTGEVDVLKLGLARCVAGEAMDPATVRFVSWDNQGRIRAAVAGDYVLGELVGATNITAAGQLCDVFVNTFAYTADT